jgi:hypothetical protein
MYFTLPTSHERQKQKTSLSKKASSSSLASTDSSVMAEDRISEIIRNLDDHWGSPPILTPDTLAHILNNQWVTSDEEELKKVHILITLIKCCLLILYLTRYLK